ncbi:MAG: hypothetical protein RR900_04635 [Ruthenibacterium sp.]
MVLVVVVIAAIIIFLLDSLFGFSLGLLLKAKP